MATRKSRRPGRDLSTVDSVQETDGAAPAKAGVSRRTLLKTGATAGVAAAVGGVAGWLSTSARGVTAQPPPAPKGPSLVLWNGKIHTMDARNRVVSAVAIKNGRFVEVGRDALDHQGHHTRVIDLQGHTVVPGIIDNPNHIHLMGNRPSHHTT